MRSLPNLGMVVQESFQNQYTSGINFYLRLMSLIGTIYFWGLASKSKKIYFLLGLVCFIPNFLTFVKGITFIMILGALLSNIIINKRKVKLNLVVQIILLGIFVFFATYIIETVIWNPEKLADKETYQFIYGKLNSYLISGIQSFNININSNTDIYKETENITIAPLVNILAKIGITERIDNVADIWIVLGEIPGYGVSSVNTNTYIGTIVLYNGLFTGLILNSAISGILYFFFYSSISNNNIVNVSRYALFSSGIILSWFEYYYMHSFWVYLILMYAAIKILSRYKLKLKSEEKLK
jgi:oligosaccharide repeat unit polymerase